MKNTNDTRNQIMNAAQDLIQRQSISGVSFQELAKRIGIKKGSMYYHFESKDDLSVAVLERATEQLQASFERGEHYTPQAQLSYFIGLFLQFAGPGQKICPGGAFAGEWDRLNERVQDQARGLMEVQLKGIENILQAGLRSGDFEGHDLSVEALSQWVIASIQGALLVSRVTGNAEAFENSMASIKSYLYKTKQD